MRESASSLRRPSTNRSASARSVCPFRAGEAAVAQRLRIRSEQLGRRRHAPGEVVLQVLDDRAGRADGELLACNLEDERPEGVEWRKPPQATPAGGSPAARRSAGRAPGPLTKELARLGIGNRGSLAGWRLHAHGFSSRS
jgi:hypothetical protein